MTRIFAVFAAIGWIAAVVLVAPKAALGGENDYPTATRAEYVFACMAANGQTPEMLQKCACVIDRIAERLPFARYEAAETVLRMQLMPGDRAAPFRAAPWATATVDELNRAQAEATLRCF
jgi:hypothetical protein